MIILSSRSLFRRRRLKDNKMVACVYSPFHLASCFLLPLWPSSFVALLLSLSHHPAFSSVSPTHPRLYATAPNTLYMFLV